MAGLMGQGGVMRRKIRPFLPWAPVAALWVAGYTATVMETLGVPLWWWFHLLREPMTAGLIAAWSICLAVRPVGALWRLAYRTGYNDARAEVALECPGHGHDADATVLPFIPPQRGLRAVPDVAQQN